MEHHGISDESTCPSNSSSSRALSRYSSIGKGCIAHLEARETASCLVLSVARLSQKVILNHYKIARSQRGSGGVSIERPRPPGPPPPSDLGPPNSPLLLPDLAGGLAAKAKEIFIVELCCAGSGQNKGRTQQKRRNNPRAGLDSKLSPKMAPGMQFN